MRQTAWLAETQYFDAWQVELWISEKVAAGVIFDRPIIRWLALDLLFDRQHGECAACHSPLGTISSFDLDHKVARCNGGNDLVSNLQLLCVPCHRRKTKIDLASAVEREEAKLTKGNGYQ